MACSASLIAFAIPDTSATGGCRPGSPMLANWASQSVELRANRRDLL